VWEDQACGLGPATLVTLRFEAIGARTRLTFRQSGFACEAERDGHADGWAQCLDKLDTWAREVVRQSAQQQQ
jgi:uncharacterized protein YndB with AHSA1/START domain